MSLPSHFKDEELRFRKTQGHISSTQKTQDQMYFYLTLNVDFFPLSTVTSHTAPYLFLDTGFKFVSFIKSYFPSPMVGKSLWVKNTGKSDDDKKEKPLNK